ncbi:hypothetical protein CPB84DRAFT_763738 [Gymnopilus junonius]|uniref:Uncharacterized protein n=1 Tax=Gymnopilus junonius TaxID=109634 RepID=A0A9P5NX76_GYMJU|nr:hypothetical protein CPB84DRAFT_763738 [Gymnopilus junonius]
MNFLQNTEALPRETLDHIVDDLGHEAEEEDDSEDEYSATNALGSCVLVSQSFRERTCRYLSVALVVDISPTPESDAYQQKLLAILKASANFPGFGISYHLRSMTFLLILRSQSAVKRRTKLRFKQLCLRFLISFTALIMVFPASNWRPR